MNTLQPAVLLALALSLPAFANSGGKNSSNCSNCHSGGGVPTVTVLPSVATAVPGQSLSIVVSISTPATQPSAGFNLKASGGTLAPGDSSVRSIGAELTHKAAKAGANGAVTFSANWTAPTSPGSYTFTALGNAVNGDGSTGGDMNGTGTATLTVVGGGGSGGGTDGGTNVDAGTDGGPGADAGTGGGTNMDAGTGGGAGADAGTDPDAGTGGGAGGGAGGGPGSAGGNTQDAGTGGVNTGTDPGAPDDEKAAGCASTGGPALGLYALAWLLGRLARRPGRSGAVR